MILGFNPKRAAQVKAFPQLPPPRTYISNENIKNKDHQRPKSRLSRELATNLHVFSPNFLIRHREGIDERDVVHGRHPAAKDNPVIRKGREGEGGGGSRHGILRARRGEEERCELGVGGQRGGIEAGFWDWKSEISGEIGFEDRHF